MQNLKEMKKGAACKVTWMVGPYADMLRNLYHVHEDDSLFVIQNMPGAMIISCHGKVLAMDYALANGIKVTA